MVLLQFLCFKIKQACKAHFPESALAFNYSVLLDQQDKDHRNCQRKEIISFVSVLALLYCFLKEHFR